MALQSDLLLAIIGSKSKVGNQLIMELNEGTQCNREDALDLSVWNLVSLCVVSSAPELRFVGLLGEGGFGIVVGTSFKGQDSALKCEISSAKNCTITFLCGGKMNIGDKKKGAFRSSFHVLSPYCNINLQQAMFQQRQTRMCIF
jgi:hypothetical protein